MTLRAAAVVIVLGVAASGCAERRAPAAATPVAAIEVPTPAPTPPAPRRPAPARPCVTDGVPFAVRQSRVAMARRSVVTGARRRLDPVVWAPRGGRCARPLVVFSHGHHGAPSSCGDLCPRLARAGFLVVAPRHADRAADRVPLQAGERVDDVTFVLDHLRGPYDRRRIGVAGHSFGGRTAGEIGAQDPRVRAVVSLAGTAAHGTMASTRVPTLIAAGTRDPIEPVATSRASARAIAPTIPHQLLVVRGARHGQLLDGCVQIGACELVGRRVEAFFLRYLAGQAATFGGR
jgi:dienelactone hydrolase